MRALFNVYTKEINQTSQKYNCNEKQFIRVYLSNYQIKASIKHSSFKKSFFKAIWNDTSFDNMNDILKNEILFYNEKVYNSKSKVLQVSKE